MSRLKAVKPTTTTPRKPQILIFGDTGVGKTFGAMGFPNVYMIDCEGGATREHYTRKLEQNGGAYFGIAQGSNNFRDVIEQVKALREEKHTFKTLIIDSITTLFDKEVQEEQDRMDKENTKDVFGASKKPAVRQTRRLLNLLRDMDMNVILIAREAIEWGKDDKGQPVELSKKWDTFKDVAYDLDLILRIVKLGKSDEAKRNAVVFKSRIEAFKIDEAFKWDYETFASKYGADVINRAVEPIILCTKEQLIELSRLRSVWKEPEDFKETIFKREAVESLEEIKQDRMQKYIDHIKEIIKKQAEQMEK